MPKLTKGPFTFRYGTGTITNVSEVSVDYTVDTSDTTTLDGRRYSVQTGMSMTVSLTLLYNDVASLATLLPQYYISGGTGDKTLSTGEEVTGPVIDVAAASCGDDTAGEDLEIIGCGENPEVLRLINAKTRIDSVDIGDGLRTITVLFTGEPEGNDAVFQLFARNTVAAHEPAEEEPATP